MRRKLLAVVVVLLLALAGLEGALRLAPGLLPPAYRESFPSHGVELYRAGVLGDTPIEGFALPRVPLVWDAPPPQDLVDYGIAEPTASFDRERRPHAYVPADARGFPNVEALEEAEVVLIGDSFLVTAGATEPAGLVPLLAERLNASVYSLGVSGIGPLQEAWLVEHVALELAPELVLWFFFGGNDLSDAKNVLSLLKEGKRVRTDLDGYRAPPALRLFDLASFLASGAGPAPVRWREPLPPLRLLHPADAEGEPLWFHPLYLGRCGIAVEGWRAHVAWERTRELLRETRARVEAGGARFGIVYLPSKAEALLPYVTADDETLARHAAFDLPDGLPMTPAESRRLLLENRSAMGTVLAEFCAGEEIPFLAATPALEALAAEGQSGFFSADTHWNERGQAALLEPLVEWAEKQGLWR